MHITSYMPLASGSEYKVKSNDPDARLETTGLISSKYISSTSAEGRISATMLEVAVTHASDTVTVALSVKLAPKSTDAVTAFPPPPPPPPGAAHVPSALRKLLVPPKEFGTEPGELPANCVILRVRFADISPPPVNGAVVLIVLEVEIPSVIPYPAKVVGSPVIELKGKPAAKLLISVLSFSYQSFQ